LGAYKQSRGYLYRSSNAHEKIKCSRIIVIRSKSDQYKIVSRSKRSSYIKRIPQPFFYRIRKKGGWMGGYMS